MTDPLFYTKPGPPMSGNTPPLEQKPAPPMSGNTPPMQTTTSAPTQPASFLPPTAKTSPSFPAPPATPTPTFDLDQHAGADADFVSKVPASGLPDDMRTTKTPGQAWPDFLPKRASGMPTAEKWDVTADQTVEGRFASVMDSGNPVFQVVQEQIMRQHAAAGGQNSLMAARSAAMAVADVGFKIASQDAATFARSAEFNAAMANQFGLAEQQFMHNAMLSEQNFKQGVMMLREQHAANLDQINADLSSRMKLMGLEANINLQMETTRQGHILQQIDKNFRNSMETMQAQFEYNWETAEQSQGQALERMDRETSNELYRGEAQFGWQQQLNYMSELGQNSRMLLSAMGEIGSNPNITAAQASSAVADVLRQYNAVNKQLEAVYTAPAIGGISTNYLNFSQHNIGYGTNTAGPQPAIPFYGGPPAPSQPAPTSPGPPMSGPTPPVQGPPAPQPTSPPPTNPTPPPIPPATPPTTQPPTSGTAPSSEPPWRRFNEFGRTRMM